MSSSPANHTLVTLEEKTDLLWPTTIVEKLDMYIFTVCPDRQERSSSSKGNIAKDVKTLTALQPMWMFSQSGESL